VQQLTENTLRAPVGVRHQGQCGDHIALGASDHDGPSFLRRGDFTSREHLEAQITEFTIRHNQTAHPYKWSYDADADHARYLERHPRQQNLAQAA
jgi:hypothetical protein